MLESFKPGVYNHYKGGIYHALGLVTHHDTRHPMVVYVNAEKAELTVRPLRGWVYDNDEHNGCTDEDGWLDSVGGSDFDDPRMDRFVFVRSMTPTEIERANDIVSAALKIHVSGEGEV